MSQQKQQMEQEIINYIANNIDKYIINNIQITDFKEIGVDDLKDFLFYKSDKNRNEYINEPQLIDLPTNKREYYKLIEEITKYFIEQERVCADLIIDFNDLFKDRIQVSYLYGRMVFDKVIDKAIEQYLVHGPQNEINMELVNQYLVLQN
jgi:hypothetical protein